MSTAPQVIWDQATGGPKVTWDDEKKSRRTPNDHWEVQSEKPAPSPITWEVASEKPAPPESGFLSGVKSALGVQDKQPSLWDATKKGLYGASGGLAIDVAKNLYDTARNAPRRISEAWNDPIAKNQPLGAKIGYATGATLAPLFGGSPESMRARGERGDEAGIWGEAAVPTAMAISPMGAELASKALPSKAGLGLALRTGKGAVKPGVRGAAGLLGGGAGGAAGYLAGEALGIPGWGAAAGTNLGAMAGYGLADFLIPERPFDIPTKTSPGAPMPSAGEFYENKAADLVRREAAERAIQRRTALTKSLAIKPDPFSGATPTDKPIGNAPLPKTSTPLAVQPEVPGITTRAGLATEASPSSLAITPADRGPRFTGSEGRPATWTNERVIQLAQQGNREAIAQLGRRGLELPENTRYVAGDLDYPRVVYNPREVTRFSPEGTPIGQGGRQIQAAPTFKGLPGYRESEKAATMSGERKSLGPEWEQGEVTHQTERYKAILRDPRATPADIAEARARLIEAGAQ